MGGEGEVFFFISVIKIIILKMKNLKKNRKRTEVQESKTSEMSLVKSNNKVANACTTASVQAALLCLTLALRGLHVEASKQTPLLQIVGNGCF